MLFVGLTLFPDSQPAFHCLQYEKQSDKKLVESQGSRLYVVLLAKLTEAYLEFTRMRA